MKSSKLPGMLSVKSKKGLDYMDMILKTTDLCKNFKGQMAVNNVSLNIRRNSVYGLLGPNGAGKSTILKMLTGILRPTSGSIEFDGHPWKLNDLEHIGALIEMPPLYENLPAYENLKVRTTLLGLDDARINEVLQIVQLTNTGKKRAGQFSLGMKQRLAIALAVMHDPEVLILDEQINGLDPIGIAEVRSFIRELCDARGKTILISSHILSEISLLADDIGIIDHGALLEEESLAELEQKSSKHIRFTLSDTAQAARILERNFHENHFSIQDDHNLRLHNLDLPVGKIVTAFVENGLEVSEAHTCEESLEDYFKRVTGGEGIA